MLLARPRVNESVPLFLVDGVKRRLGGSLRRYIKERWEPTGGAGYNFTNRFGIDVGLFSTSANFERKRHLAIAFSLRLMAKQQRHPRCSAARPEAWVGPHAIK